MLLKLLKYDFRAMWKQFSLIWGAALVLALVTRFTSSSHFRLRYLDFEGRVSSLISTVFIAVFVAMFVIAVVFVINRFSKGLLGDEGYLMHTLPVRSWQLVTSKLICGTVTWIVSVVVAILSPVLMLPLNLPDLLQLPWTNLFRGILKHPGIILMMLEFCLLIVSAIALFISVMYLSMAIGHLFSRHRKLICIAVFIGLYVLLINIYGRVFSLDLVQHVTDVITSNTYGSMLTAIAVMLIPAALFLAAVCWILEHKLNLE